VVAPKDARIGPTVARLSGVPALGVTEARPAQYAMLGEMDFRHPLFAAFADARFSDFTRIHVWHYRRFVASDIPGCLVHPTINNTIRQELSYDSVTDFMHKVSNDLNLTVKASFFNVSLQATLDSS